MNPLEPLQIDPDIQILLLQFKMHHQSKSKILEELLNILKQICDFQHFYAKNMDKFANSVSKLIEGKDPLKDVFIVFERMLATKSQQSSEIAMNIKDDMIPFLQQKLFSKQCQFSVKLQQFRSAKRQSEAKNMRMVMQKKLKMLKLNQNAYKRAHLTLKPRSRQPIFSRKNTNDQMSSELNQNYKSYSSRQLNKIQKLKGKGQQNSEKIVFEVHSNLIRAISSFNHTFTKYMELYSQVCNQFTGLQTERNGIVRDAMNKFMIYQMNVARSIQYSVARYVKGLQEGSKNKILIHDVGLTSFSNFKEDQIPSNIIKLAKVQPENYKLALKDSITIPLSFKDQDDRSYSELRNQASKQQFFMFLKQNFRVPQQIQRKQYHQIIMQSFSMLTSCSIYGDVTFLKELINQYSKGLYMKLDCSNDKEGLNDANNKQIIQITILDGLLSHQIFREKGLWTEYTRKLIQQAKQEIKTDFKTSLNSGLKLIDNDIKMLQLLGMNDNINKIKTALKNYCIKLKNDQRVSSNTNEDISSISSGSLGGQNNRDKQTSSKNKTKLQVQNDQKLKKQIQSLF